ncbi:hypothetical protein E2651_41980 [Streptomyces sp. MZ04]|nr:hypothetical protein E2651_41980 [Streptomyces sp. MZ04]
MPGTDAQALAVLATETSQRAHSMMRALTAPSRAESMPKEEAVPADPAHDAVRLAARHHLHIPLQRRLEGTLDMTEEELARAVADWAHTSGS